MKSNNSDVFINNIVWNPESARWVSVVELSYGSSSKRSKQLLSSTVAFCLFFCVYNPTTTYKHQTFKLVELSVDVNNIEQFKKVTN